LKDGWLHTGDIGYLDDEGDLWILNRRTDLIVSGGENIYPAEIERVLRSHPQVVEACVVGLPHADWGQQVVALVQLDITGAVREEDLMRFTRRHLAGYKRPRQIMFVEEMPLTGSGKIHRRAVEELLMENAEQA
jgi:O-succinylbenzoic acid--CoA ligase